MRLKHQGDEKTGPERASEGPNNGSGPDKTLGLPITANISQNPAQFQRDARPLRAGRTLIFSLLIKVGTGQGPEPISLS